MKCKANEGKTDRILRLVLGLVVFGVGYLYLTGTLQVISMVIGVVVFLTGVTGFCGLYTLLHFTTLPKDKQ